MQFIGALFALAALIGAAGFTARMVSNLPRTPPRIRKAAGRTATAVRHPVRASRQAGSRAPEIWAQARAQNWLERQQARRAARALHPASERRTVLGRLTVPKGSGFRPVNGSAAPAPAKSPPPAGMKPAARPSLRAVPPLTSERTSPVTTGTSVNGLGAGADMLTSVQHLVTHVLSGGIQGKQRGALTASESLSYMADQFTTMAHRMAEPDQGYPASVWEPWLVVASHLQAASIAAGESGSFVGAIRAMTVGELAGSSVRAPHHDELNKGA
ncbi:MAG: hypothetical protein ACLQFR_29925 [Streptosporangiaceae bacterium]